MPKKKPNSKLPDIDVNCVRARCIELVDARGNLRATFVTSSGCQKNQSATLIQMFGDDGLPQLELQIIDGSPGIRLTAPNDRVGFSVSVDETSNAIMIGDAEGRAVAQMGVYHQGGDETPFGSKPFVLLSDYDGGTESIDVAIEERKIIQPRKKGK